MGMCKRPCQQDGRRGHLRKSLRRFSFEAQHDGGTDFLGEPIAAQMRLQEGRELVPRAPLRVSSLSVSVCVTTLFSSKPTLPFTRDHFKWTATAEVSGSLHSGTRSKAASNRASRKRDVNRDSISDCMFPVPDPLNLLYVSTAGLLRPARLRSCLRSDPVGRQTAHVCTGVYFKVTHRRCR